MMHKSAKYKPIFWTVLFTLCLFLSGCSANETTLNVTAPSQYEDITQTNSSSCEIMVMDVNQGLSVLFETDGKYVLYDGGGRETSAYLVSKLNDMGIQCIDYMIVSHYDEDHIAGLIGVLNTTSVNNVICPDYETDTKIYQSFISAINKSGANIIHPQLGDVFEESEMTMTVISADYISSEENDCSIAILFSIGEKSIIISGDCSAKKEADIIADFENIDCDILVAAHHGSRYSNSEMFLNKTTPDYVIISCGENNEYGHPHQEVLDRVSNYNAAVYRTDLQGNITIEIEGNDVNVEAKDIADTVYETETTENVR